jgi:membrane protein DedA with SNARE-associated domain/rhodanese-related sulfurtransferase
MPSSGDRRSSSDHRIPWKAMDDLMALVAAHGAGLVFVATLAARLGAPVPAAPFLVVAGSLSLREPVGLAAIVAMAVIGSSLGDGAWYWAGRRYGYRMLKLLCKVSMSPDSCVSQSENIFARWGGRSLVAAKFVPGVSVVAPPMAGALGMPLPTFIGYELLASAVWAAAFLALGLVFSGQIQAVLGALAATGTGAMATLCVVALAYLAWRWWRRWRFLRIAKRSRIGVDELKALIDAGTPPIVIDVRSALGRSADPRSIPQAMPLPLDELRRAAAGLPRGRVIVAYCNCPNDASAVTAARVLAEAGLAGVRPLAGGLEAWVAAGHPVGAHDLQAPETGAHEGQVAT